MSKKSPQKKKTSSESASHAKAGLIRKRAQARQVRKTQAKQSFKKLTGSFRLFTDTASFVRQHWKIFGGIVMVYLVLSVVLLGAGGSGINVRELKDNFSSTSGTTGIGADLTLFGLILGTSATPSQAGAPYQPMVFLVISLASIWALRQLMAGKKISVRDSFYKGMYPLVPVVLVALVVGLQLMPITLATFLAGVAFTGGLAVGFFEVAGWSILIFLLSLLSLYMVTSSIFAFYIATLPDMRPMAALRSARQLVRYRRWTVMRKVLFLPLALLVAGAIITMPFIWILPVIAPWVFLVLSMIGLIFAHTYIYSLYRELL